MKQIPQDDSIFQIHADFCTVMSNDKRLRILWMLGEREEMTVGKIAEALGVSMANASQHLRIMRGQRAVVSRKDRQQVYYRLSNPIFYEGCKMIHQGLVELSLVRPEMPSSEMAGASKGGDRTAKAI